MLRAAICDDESVILSMMKSSIEKTFYKKNSIAVYKLFLLVKNY